MRVAIVHYTVSPVVGGVERVIERHAGLLAQDGHTVTIVAGRGDAERPGVVTHHVGLVDSADPRILALRADLDRGVMPERFEETVSDLAAALRSTVGDHDILIAHNVCSLPFNLALTAALRRLAGEPSTPSLVAWHHDLAWTQERFRSVLHAGYPWDLLRTPWPRVRHATVSWTRRTELAGMLGIPEASIRVVRNGIDVASELGVEPWTAALLARTGMLEADPLLLLPSRVTPRKNIGLGLEVVAEMRRLGSPAALIVTGPVDPHDPSQRAHLDELLALRRHLGIEEAVWLLAAEDAEPLSDGIVTDLYRIADALLLPSLEEGFGLPILEAALHRLPIVCSDLPVLREVAGDAATYVDPDAAPGDIARAVMERLDGDAMATLRRRVRREHGWATVYRDELRPLLEEVMAARASKPAV